GNRAGALCSDRKIYKGDKVTFGRYTWIDKAPSRTIEDSANRELKLLKAGFGPNYGEVLAVGGPIGVSSVIRDLPGRPAGNRRPRQGSRRCASRDREGHFISG